MNTGNQIKERMSKTVKTPGTPPFLTDRKLQPANTLELLETYRTLTYINMANTGIPKPPDQTGRAGPQTRDKCQTQKRERERGREK